MTNRERFTKIYPVEVLQLYYRDYQNLRDASWRILLDCGIDRLPVDIDTICRKLGVRVLSYDAGAELIERAHLYRAVRHNDGLAFYLQNTPVILFDETMELPRATVTVAHELGHIILDHVQPGGATASHPGMERRIASEEKAADRFAVRLLAPACVLWALNARTPEEIMALCQIPRPAAEYRARRMAALYERGRFLTSPLERRLYHQFQPYLSARAPARCPGA